MHSKKKIVIISTIIIVVSIMIYTIALIYGNEILGEKVVEWIKTIFSGMLASAVVTLLVYLGEYYTERRAAIEQYCELNYKTTRYYINLSYYEENIATDVEIFSEALTEYKQLIADVQQCPIGSCYANLDFIFDNERIRSKIAYRRIYMRQDEIRNRLNELLYYIDAYEKELKSVGKSRLQSTLASKILEIQSLIFEVETIDGVENIYASFVYDIETAVYEMLKYLYKEQYHIPEPDKRMYRCLVKANIQIDKNDE